MCWLRILRYIGQLVAILPTLIDLVKVLQNHTVYGDKAAVVLETLQKILPEPVKPTTPTSTGDMGLPATPGGA